MMVPNWFLKLTIRRKNMTTMLLFLLLHWSTWTDCEKSNRCILSFRSYAWPNPSATTFTACMKWFRMVSCQNFPSPFSRLGCSFSFVLCYAWETVAQTLREILHLHLHFKDNTHCYERQNSSFLQRQKLLQIKLTPGESFYSDSARLEKLQQEEANSSRQVGCCCCLCDSWDDSTASCRRS